MESKSSYEKFETKSIDLFRYQLKEVLTGIFHTIVFNRCLRTPEIEEGQCSLFDIDSISYIKIKDKQILLQIEKGINDILLSIENIDKKKKSSLLNTSAIGLPLSNKAPTIPITIQMSFYYTKINKVLGLISKEKKICWETWSITLNLHSEFSSRTGKSQLEIIKGIKDFFFHILLCVNEKRQHVPPAEKEICFPFEIAFITDNSLTYSYFASFKQILTKIDPHPFVQD